VMRDYSCPQCKQNCELVICTPDVGAVYTDFEIWGEQIPGFSFDHTSRMFFPPDHYKSKIEALRKSVCRICQVAKRDIKALRAHMTADHKLQMCALCIEHKHAFPSEQRVYSQAEYENHLRRGIVALAVLTFE